MCDTRLVSLQFAVVSRAFLLYQMTSFAPSFLRFWWDRSWPSFTCDTCARCFLSRRGFSLAAARQIQKLEGDKKLKQQQQQRWHEDRTRGSRSLINYKTRKLAREWIKTSSTRVGAAQQRAKRTAAIEACFVVVARFCDSDSSASRDQAGKSLATVRNACTIDVYSCSVFVARAFFFFRRIFIREWFWRKTFSTVPFLRYVHV